MLALCIIIRDFAPRRYADPTVTNPGRKPLEPLETFSRNYTPVTFAGLSLAKSCREWRPIAVTVHDVIFQRRECIDEADWDPNDGKQATIRKWGDTGEGK